MSYWGKNYKKNVFVYICKKMSIFQSFLSLIHEIFCAVCCNFPLCSHREKDNLGPLIRMCVFWPPRTCCVKEKFQEKKFEKLRYCLQNLAAIYYRQIQIKEMTPAYRYTVNTSMIRILGHGISNFVENFISMLHILGQNIFYFIKTYFTY